MNFLQPIGRVTFSFLEIIGRLIVFIANSVMHATRPTLYPRLILKQMIEIGYFSLPVVGLTAVFAGMVLALQSYTGFFRFAASQEMRPRK